MKKKPLLFLLAVCVWGAPTVSSITFDGIGDSSVRVIFNSTSYNVFRIRYGTASCSGGTGTVQTNGTSPSTYVLYGATGNLAGLAPSTPYHVCPETSSDGGATWSTGADATFTTLARTTTLPIAPAAVSTTFPAQSGATLTVASNCSDLQAKLDTASDDQGLGMSDTVIIPTAPTCTGYYTTKRASDSLSFTPSDVVTSNSTIAVASASFSPNQEVRLSTGSPNTGCLPGMLIFPYGLNCDKGGGWRKGGRYYVHIVDGAHVQILDAPSGNPVVPGWINFTADATADTITFLPTWQTPCGFTYLAASAGTNCGAGGLGPYGSIPANTVIQLVSTGTLPGGLSANTNYFLLGGCSMTAVLSPCVSQLSLTSGGAAINITSAGTGTHTIVDQGLGTMYIAPAPTQSGPWVLIKTSGTLPPAGTKIDPSLWSGQMAVIQNASSLVTTPSFQPGILAHNWRMLGITFNTGTNNDYLTSTDPRPYCGGPSTLQDSSFIIFDQVWIHGPGYPNRFGCRTQAANMNLDGFNVGFINYYFDNFDFWKPWYSGLAPTRASASQVTATAGVGHGGNFTTTTTATTTINFTGGATTGTAYVYFKMDGTMEVLAATSTTGNCSTTGTTCNFTTTGSPAFPATGGGPGDRSSCLKLFTIALSGGAVTSVSAADASTTSNPGTTEGSNTIIAGNGPGPYILSNGYFSGAGLPMHYDDSGGPFLPRSDFTVNRNYFTTPAKYQSTQSGSDGLRYFNRQIIEWKGGQRIQMDGDIFDNCFIEVNSVGACSVVTPRGGGYVTDWDVTNNSFLNTGGGTEIATPVDSLQPDSKPAARQRIQNNLALIDAWHHYNSIPGVANPNGIFNYGGYGSEDILINHNTVYNELGTSPGFIHWVLYPVGGMTVQNNVYFYTGDAAMIQNESNTNCPGNDKAFADCAFTAGPGNTSYGFDANLIIPSWAATQTQTGFEPTATVCGAFGTWTGSACSPNPLSILLPLGASQPANVALVKFNADYSLDPTSPYHHSENDGTDPGYNPITLKAAQGAMDFTSVTPASNGATFAYYDWFGTGEICNVFVGTGAITSATPTPDSGTGNSRSTNVIGLATNTLYNYWVVCPSVSSSGTFTTPAGIPIPVKDHGGVSLHGGVR